MLRHTLAWCVLVLAVQVIAPAHGQPAADVVLYEGARLIPGDGRAAIDESAFMVDRGVITRVGRKGELSAAAGVKRVDLSGKTWSPCRSYIKRRQLPTVSAPRGRHYADNCFFCESAYVHRHHVAPRPGRAPRPS